MKKQQNKVKYKGVVYEIDRSHQNILEIFDWIQNGELDEIDQAIMLVDKLFGVEAPVEQPLINLGEKILTLGKENKESVNDNKPRDMDFLKDYDIYRADIIREYGIDIAKENIDFDTLVNLLENLSKDSRFNQVREIRNKKLSEIKDLKERKAWKEAQDYYRLDEPITKEEKEEDKESKELTNKFIQKFM